jgi:tetratricopeptide (TPR) repeat protein
VVHPRAVSRLVLAYALCALCACQKPLDAKLQAGDAAARAGKWENARTAWTEATLADPRSAVAHAKLGVALWQLGLKDEAAAAWSAAVSIDPNAEDAVGNLARLDLERLDPGAAVERLLLVQAPASAAFQLVLAQALLARGAPDDAAAALVAAQKASSALAGDPEADYLVGSAQIALRRFSDAQGTLEGLQRRRPELALGSYGLARLAAAQSRQTDALLHLSAARAAAGSGWNPDRVAADPAFAFLVTAPEFKALVSK